MVDVIPEKQEFTHKGAFRVEKVSLKVIKYIHRIKNEENFVIVKRNI